MMVSNQKMILGSGRLLNILSLPDARSAFFVNSVAIPEKNPIPVPVLGSDSIPILNSYGRVGFQVHPKSTS